MLGEGLEGKLIINPDTTSKKILLYESLVLNESDLRHTIFAISLGQSKKDKPQRTPLNPMIQYKYNSISVEDAEKINPYLKKSISEWVLSQPEDYEITLPEGF